MRDEKILTPATGFFYRYGEDISLITNWHVLSGTNPITGVSIGIPNHIKFNINVFYPDGRFLIRHEDIPLSIDGNTIWWQHPMEHTQIDIPVQLAQVH
jgi:hypothetical protein